jgi:hypothetical protein
MEYPERAIDFMDQCGFNKIEVVGVEGVAAEFDQQERASCN